MADDAPLILDKFESGMLRGTPRAQPDTVFVLSYADSRMRTFQRAPGFADRTGSKWCYVVDRSQRFSSGELRIPAYGGVYFFNAWYDAAWQVNDAEAVVQANLRAGGPVVAGFLKSALWPLGRQFDPKEVGQAEDTIVRSLQPPLSVGSGLTLNGLSLRLAVDSRQVDTAVADDAETRRMQQVQARVTQLQTLLPNAEPALVLHVATHPDDTDAGLELFNQTRQHDANYRLALLDRMFQNGILTDADGDVLRQMVLGAPGALPPGVGSAPQSVPALGSGSASSAAAPALGGGGSWNVPVLGVAPAAPAPAALQSGSPQAPAGPTTPTPGVPQSWPASTAPTAPAAPTGRPSASTGRPSALGLSGPQDQPSGARPPVAPRRAPDPTGPQDQPSTAGRPAAAADQASGQPAREGGVKKWKKFERPTPS